MNPDLDYIIRHSDEQERVRQWEHFHVGDLVDVRGYLEVRLRHGEDLMPRPNVYLSFNRIVRLARYDEFSSVSIFVAQLAFFMGTIYAYLSLGLGGTRESHYRNH